MVYAIQHPFTGELLYPYNSSCWRYDQDTMLEIMNGWCRYELRDLDDAQRRADVCGVSASEVREGVKGIVLADTLEESRKQAHIVYERDYILEDHEGAVWIIEAKGGQKKGGESENVDRYAPKKFDALKGYAERHPELKTGFVRYDKKSLQLRIATREYSEDLDEADLLGPKWLLLKDVL